MCYTFPKVLTLRDFSYLKTRNTEQLKNIQFYPRICTFKMRSIINSVVTKCSHDRKFSEKFSGSFRKHRRQLLCKKCSTCLQPVNYTFIRNIVKGIFPEVFRSTPLSEKFPKFDKIVSNIFRGIFLRRKFPQGNFPGFIKIKRVFTAVNLYFLDV